MSKFAILPQSDPAPASIGADEAVLPAPETAIADAPRLAPDLAELGVTPITQECVPLADVPQAAWAALARDAIEPNVFYAPGWARAVAAHARGHQGAKALLAWSGPGRHTLIGLLPVHSARAALALPLPALVAWQAYARLTTPLLHRDLAIRAARGLLDAAAAEGAHALLLPDLPTNAGAMLAFRHALSGDGTEPRILRDGARAWLDAKDDADAKLHAALGSKKLKELRRQRHRLADDGAVSFTVASEPDDVAAALECFLALEASGWKGRRSTALARDAGDGRFIREAAQALARHRAFEVVTLKRGNDAVAAGIVLRHHRRAYFFKIAFDESLARLSPGVQLTLDLTRRLCGDGRTDDVDSMADPNHPMIDHVWRDRYAVGDVFIPLGARRTIAPVIQTLIRARAFAREHAKPFVHRLRAFRERIR
ncbi:MAG: GNAT family N-acetyltransferase [Pseudorhodoplanes sp.]